MFETLVRTTPNIEAGSLARSLRKTILLSAILGAFAASFTGAPAFAQAVHNLKIGGIYTPTSIQGRTTQKFADLIKEKSGGKIVATVFPNAQLGDEQQMLQSALSPTFRDIVTLSVTIMTTLEPQVGATNLPFLFRDDAHIKTFSTGKGFEAQRDLLLKGKGLRMLAAWNYPPINIYTRKPVKQLSDLKNMKIRVPPAAQYVKLFQQFGANPTPVPFSELYIALQTGVIEGTMGTDDIVLSGKLTEVTKYAIDLRYQIVFGNPVVPERFFQSLAPELQKALIDAAEEAGEFNRKIIAEAGASVQDGLRKTGMEIINVSDMDAWKAAAAPLVEQFEKDHGAALVQTIRSAK